MRAGAEQLLDRRPHQRNPCRSADQHHFIDVLDPHTRIRNAGPAGGQRSLDDRLDQAVIAVLAPVEHVDPLVLGVYEDEEAVAELLHLGHRVLLEHRLDREALRLDDPSLVRRLRGSVRDPPQDLFLGLRAGTQARFALEVDRLAFDLVHDRVDACLVRQGSGVAAQRLPVDDERDLHDLRVGGASVVLDPELHDGVAPIVEQPLQPFEAPFGVAARAFGNFEVLPLDDGPHG